MKISALALAFLGLASGHDIREENGKPRHHQSKTVRGADSPRIEERKLCGVNDLRNAQCYKDSEPAIYNAAKAVVAQKFSNGNPWCTGWMVGPNNYMMTNHHCISTQERASELDYHFMYESANGSCQAGGVHDTDVTSAKVITGATLVWADEALDAALVKLPGDPVCEFGYYDITDQPPVVGRHIYIPQHPAGRDKSIGITDSFTSSGFCEIGKLVGNQVHYTCDTEGGTSGSPVVDKNNPKMVVALHFGGWHDCHGNVAHKMSSIYPHVKQWVYDEGNFFNDNCNSGGSGGGGGGCTDISGWTDSFGDGCEWYANSATGCQDYATDVGTDGKTPVEACCACQGTTGTSPPTGGGGGCTDTSGWTDSYGDDCSYYEENETGCQDYATDVGSNGLTPVQACCVCKE